MARYEAGETLSSIARTYDCSPPAISYVVSRSRARPPEPAPKPAPPVEPQLIKAASAEASSAGAGHPAPPFQPNGSAGNGAHPAAAGERHFHPVPQPVQPLRRPPEPPLAAPANGDHRRTLHLSLGNNDPIHPAEAPAVEVRPTQAQTHYNNGAASNGRGAADHAAVQPHGGDGQHKPAGAFIDHQLRARVDGDIAAFLAAFDAALLQDTPESRSALREATDRLLRAGARTRIELERLEARLPLPTRHGGGPGEPAWGGR